MKKIISIVTPTYNEEKNIEELTRQIAFQMENTNYDYEHIIIDNASNDNTQNLIRKICSENKFVKAIFNTRNFGHIRSPFYGILQTKGDAVILMSSDFQDPPELIPALLEKWNSGSDIVLLKRKKSKENVFIELLKNLSYKIIKLLSELYLTEKTTGSGIIDKKIVEHLKKIDDPYPYFRGLILEFSNKVSTLEFYQPKRAYGRSKNNFFTLFDIGMLGIIKHSKVPIRIMTIAGLFLSLLSLIVGAFFLFYKLFYWDSFQLGVAPLILGVFFGISIQIMMLGVIGEYVSFILTQVRNLPLVIERERINF